MRAATYKYIFSLLIFLCSGSSFSFVFVNGPQEAKLDASEDSPTVEFIWNGKAPKLTDKSDFQGGAWAQLSDEQVMENLINLSLAIWNAVPGSYIDLQLGEIDTTAEADEKDEIHVITVGKIDSATASAFALPTPENGIIKDCDITIGDQEQSLGSLALTITHELGHCLGLGHPHTSYKSIMSYSNPERTLELSADDMAGIIYLYPDTAFEADDIEPLACGTTGIKFDETVATYLGLFFLLMIPFIFRLSSIAFLLSRLGKDAQKAAAKPVNSKFYKSTRR